MLKSQVTFEVTSLRSINATIKQHFSNLSTRRRVSTTPPSHPFNFSLPLAMSLGACTELSHYLALPPVRPNFRNCKCTTGITYTLHNAIGGYNGVLSTSMSKRIDTIVVSAKAAGKVESESESDSGSESENENEGESEGLTYKDAGVDIDAGSELVRRIAKMTPGIGGFGGLFPFGDSYLVAGTDGVGTKLLLAIETGIHDTIGIDLVAMSVNDIVTSGAKPLFFLDYFATGHLNVDVAEKVIKGIVEGCKISECVLLGGETAEMPGLYKEGDYDLSGSAVGSVKKEDLIDGKNITVGDIIIGLPSSGVHSNGFSLVRRVVDQSGLQLNDKLPGGDVTIAKALLAPTTIYVKQVLDIISKGGVKGIAHITGGGFTDNIPRVFPEGLGALIYEDSWDIPAVFKWLQEAGKIKDTEMMRTFNMGIGMVLVVSPEAAKRILENPVDTGKAYHIGEVISGNGVTYS